MSATFEKLTFVIADPVAGGFWYAVQRDAGSIESARVDGPDGELMTADAEHYPKWLHSFARAQRIHITKRARLVTTGYRLRDDLGPTDANPATLTADEGRERADNEDSFDSFYVRVTEPGEPVVEVWDVADRELVGSPWPDDTVGAGLGWDPDPATKLSVDGRFHHLMPGRLTGVVDAVRRELDALPSSYVFSSEWKVQKRLLDPPKPKPKRGPGSRTEPKRTWRTVEVPIPRPPRTLEAKSRDEAIERYRVIRDAAVAQFDAVHRCPGCDGKGWQS